MNKFFQYRAKLFRGWRKKVGGERALDALYTFQCVWLKSSYYERMWDLTPKNNRPRGMYALWIRRLSC